LLGHRRCITRNSQPGNGRNIPFSTQFPCSLGTPVATLP
jgi:hypothetical protein